MCCIDNTLWCSITSVVPSHRIMTSSPELCLYTESDTLDFFCKKIIVTELSQFDEISHEILKRDCLFQSSNNIFYVDFPKHKHYLAREFLFYSSISSLVCLHNDRCPIDVISI